MQSIEIRGNNTLIVIIEINLLSQKMQGFDASF